MSERKFCCICGKRHNAVGDRCVKCRAIVQTFDLDTELDQLWAVLERDGPLPRSKLARMAGLPSRQVGQVINTLENKGYMIYLEDDDRIGAAWKAVENA